MPSRERVEQTLRTHFEAWNAGDRERWLANWRDDVEMFDPVGGPVKRGRAAVETTWARSFQPGQRWRLEPLFLQVCENQAALHVRNHGVIDGRPLALDSIEIYWVDDDGKLFRVQTYFAPPEGRTLDPFFMPAK
jgi:ketosteroid isomerase-like protein